MGKRALKLLFVAVFGLWAFVGCGPSVSSVCERYCECERLCSDLNACIESGNAYQNEADMAGCGTEYDALLDCAAGLSCSQLTTGNVCPKQHHAIQSCIDRSKMTL
jgi:hypothetical protein